ncbi:MAG: hypothetical protein HY290_31990 [Planctomycetia bacterium]|nr:hypothetical protein [Planctomycetia bacterium]
MLRSFWNDENGFIVSAELVLVATMAVIGLIAGLVEVQFSVVGELNDVGEAIGSLNQSYFFTGFTSRKSQGNGIKAFTVGSAFKDHLDECDQNECTLGCDNPVPEQPKGGGHHHSW